MHYRDISSGPTESLWLPHQTPDMHLGQSRLTPEQLAAAEAGFKAKYPTAKPHWSFKLSTVLDKPIAQVVSKLGGLENFETLAKLNPVCVGYTEVARDWVIVPGPLDAARVRESEPSPSRGAGAEASDGRKQYPRIKFTAKDRLTVFWGLMSGVVQQRGTYVWDEESKMALWEVMTTDTPGLETWTRKVVNFRDDGNGNTKVEEFVEGYSKESLQVLEGVAKRYTRNIHK
jgi:hypothetical protein